MAKKIEVGMLVEIVDHPTFTTQGMRKYIGCFGKVIRRNTVIPTCWVIEGLEYDPEDKQFQSFDQNHLRPIHDPDAFQTFLGECFKPVDLGVKTGEKV